MRHCIDCNKAFDPSTLYQMRCEDCMNAGIATTADDTLVESASQPNLASLFRKAKDQGLLPPVFEYKAA